MRIVAHVRNAGAGHRVSVETDGRAQSLSIAARSGAPGSAVNGGEFLMLALATCYCNDLYREAARLQVPVASVEVVAQADFDGVGIAATNVRYRARVESTAPKATIEALLAATDAVAEVHNTLRGGTRVTLKAWPAERIDETAASGPGA